MGRPFEGQGVDDHPTTSRVARSPRGGTFSLAKSVVVALVEATDVDAQR
jgi:hypothetical protein